jgi:hypothetical protein
MNDKLGMDDKAPAAAAAKKFVSTHSKTVNTFIILQHSGALALSWLTSRSINASSWASSIATAPFHSCRPTASSF